MDTIKGRFKNCTVNLAAGPISSSQRPSCSVQRARNSALAADNKCVESSAFLTAVNPVPITSATAKAEVGRSSALCRKFSGTFDVDVSDDTDWIEQKLSSSPSAAYTTGTTDFG